MLRHGATESLVATIQHVHAVGMGIAVCVSQTMLLFGAMGIGDTPPGADIVGDINIGSTSESNSAHESERTGLVLVNIFIASTFYTHAVTSS